MSAVDAGQEEDGAGQRWHCGEQASSGVCSDVIGGGGPSDEQRERTSGKGCKVALQVAGVVGGSGGWARTDEWPGAGLAWHGWRWERVRAGPDTAESPGDWPARHSQLSRPAQQPLSY